MRTKIRLRGLFRRLWPEAEIEASTPAEAVEGFLTVVKAKPPPWGGKWHMRVVECPVKDTLHGPLVSPTLTLVPEFSGGGGKGGGFIRIIIGVALVVASFFIPGAWSVGGTLLGFTETLTTTLIADVVFSMGVSLVLGGLLEVMSPQPKVSQPNGAANDPEASKYLGANQNTVAIGTRIPIIFGRQQVWGHYLSFDVQADMQPVDGRPPGADSRRATGTVRVGYR